MPYYIPLRNMNILLSKEFFYFDNNYIIKEESMPSTAQKPLKAGTSPTGRRKSPRKFPQALDSLQEFCASLQPGDLVPTHTELMRRFDVSERAVLRALEELQRSGKIVRRRGVGTFVTERNSITELTQPVMPQALVDTQTIVAILRPDHSFFERCLEVLFHHAKAMDLTVACRLVEENSEWSLPQITETRQTGGFIVFHWSLLPIARQLQDAGHRVVLVGMPPLDHTPEVPCVYNDHEQGGYLAVSHLLELGHQRIAFVGFTSWDEGLRGRGHLRAIKAWNARLEFQAARNGTIEGIPLVQPTGIHPEQIVQWERDPAHAKAFFAQPGAPTSVVAWNDQEALKLLRTLNRGGIDVPGQVSLIGYDAAPEGLMVHPSLTTINPQAEQQIQSALSLLTRPITPPSSHSVVIVPNLVVHESSASPPVV
ncbi:HTH-type transcriptional repressor PurR [Abditibacteriota bacterium]|nr:HTH-type transcriptional repressor PurR [Abditibacteriota bacterium]